MKSPEQQLLQDWFIEKAFNHARGGGGGSWKTLHNNWGGGAQGGPGEFISVGEIKHIYFSSPFSTVQVPAMSDYHPEGHSPGCLWGPSIYVAVHKSLRR